MMKGICGKMNKKEFREITEMLEQNYNKQMDTRILNLWYEEFKEYPIGAYRELVIEVIKTEKYMPTLARMIELKKPVWFSVEVKKVIPSESEKKIMEEMLKEFI